MCTIVIVLCVPTVLLDLRQPFILFDQVGGCPMHSLQCVETE